MNDLFTAYNWTGVTLLSARSTLTTKEEKHCTTTPDTYYQLGLKHTGKTDITYNGQHIPYHENTVVYLPLEKSGTVDYRRHIREGGRGACVFFHSLYPLPEVPFYLSCAAQPKIPETFFRLVAAHENDRKKNGFAAMELFYRLLSLLRETMAETMEKEPAGSALRTKLTPALSYIEAHYTDPWLDLAQLADMCGLSPDYFRHSFRRLFGFSPLQYINHRRLEHAKSLLQGGHTVAEAAALCGFAGPDYFTRCFRAHTGLTPTAFRNSLG